MFLLSDQEQGSSRWRGPSGGDGALKGRRYAMGEGVAGRAAQRRQPVPWTMREHSRLRPADAAKPVARRSVVAGAGS